jgi:hypothetical protein
MKHRILPAIAMAFVFLLPSNNESSAQMKPQTLPRPSAAHHPYVGMWTTSDGHIRHELLPDGRYDEARGARESAYRGRYEVRGTRIDYWDDTGFTADGEFVDENILLHGGMVFRRVR